jgi:transcriptional regulator with XRE-family HTH domain
MAERRGFSAAGAGGWQRPFATPAPSGAEFRRRKARRKAELQKEVVEFGKRLRRLRKAAGLSQLALAHAAVIDLAAVSFLERALRAPTVGTLVRLARALGVPPAVLADKEAAKAFPPSAVRPIRPARPLRRGPGGPAQRARKHRLDAPVLKRFGQNVRAARLAAGLSQEHLAYLAELDRAAISIIERGGRSATLRTYLKICEALGCKPADLLEGIA